MPDQLDAPWQQIVEDQLRLARDVRQALPELRVPYFAHMRLLREGRTRDVLLAGKTLIRPDITIIDWQDAPLAEVFFACREGEEYEVEVGDRTLGGTLTPAEPAGVRSEAN